MTGLTSGTVDCGTHRIYYERRGVGAPVLFIPAWGLTTGASFDDCVPAFLREQYEVITYDHRGLGRSDDAPDLEASTTSYADDAIRICEALGFDSVHVVGYGGLGACVGQHVAITRPDLVRSLALISGWAGPEPYHHAQQEIFRVLVDKADFEAFKTFMSIICYTPEYVNERGVVNSERVREPGDVHERREAHLRLIQANLDHDARGELHRVACPTLVVYPELDLLGGPRLADELISLIPNAERCELSGAPHAFSTVASANEQFREGLAGFLQRQEPAADTGGRADARH